MRKQSADKPLTALTSTLLTMLRRAPRDRKVMPTGQPFAFETNRGKVRSENQDTALVLAGRRCGRRRPFLAAILCDGMGGLDNGAEAAALAAAVIGSVLASDEKLGAEERMSCAIRQANAEIFRRHAGRVGTVVVAAMVEEGLPVLGWVGDSRAYGLSQGKEPRLLSRDDTVAAEVERVVGSPAAEALDALLQAVGVKAEVEPHVARVEPNHEVLLLASDGVHRIDPVALSWIHRHASTPAQLTHCLVWAAHVEGAPDNATALALDLRQPPLFDDEGDVLAAWIEAQPRIWQAIQFGASPRLAIPEAETLPRPLQSSAEVRDSRHETPQPDPGSRPRRGAKKARERATAPAASHEERKTNAEQPPLSIELDGSGQDEKK